MKNMAIPTQKAFRKLGQDIKDSRCRRRIPMSLMSERTGLSRGTIGKIEKGDPSVSIGGYGAVLFVLGLTDRLADLVDIQYDLVGRRLDEERLPKRVRLSTKSVCNE